MYFWQNFIYFCFIVRSYGNDQNLNRDDNERLNGSSLDNLDIPDEFDKDLFAFKLVTCTDNDDNLPSNSDKTLVSFELLLLFLINAVIVLR